MFHLFTHSAFKALLFLAAGACIHSLGYEQDIYRLGGLTKSFTLGYIFILQICYLLNRYANYNIVFQHALLQTLLNKSQYKCFIISAVPR